MRLEDQQRLTFSSCMVCVHAGRKGVILPQEYMGFTGHAGNDEPRIWEVFITGAEHGQPPQNGLRTWDVCWEHHKIVYHTWESIGQEEVDLTRAFDDWIDRTENGPDLYG